MSFRKRLEAPIEARRKSRRIAAEAKRLLRDGLDGGESILDAMIEFTHQQVLCALRLLSSGDVVSDPEV
jgi:hypothetical protein